MRASFASSQPQMSVVFTRPAASKVWELIQEEQQTALLKLWLLLDNSLFYGPLFFSWCAAFREAAADLKLRVFIKGGGCKGFRYGFDFTQTAKANDRVIYQSIAAGSDSNQETRVALVVDAISLQYLRGAQIVYQSDPQGESFVIRGLKAKTTCGCGASFSVE
jgi:iron-sulfur cluster insertion protein